MNRTFTPSRMITWLSSMFVLALLSYTPLKAQFDTGDTIACVSPTITTFPYIEDFENGKGGWFSGPLSPTLSRCNQNVPTPNSWAFGTPNKPVRATPPQTALNRACSGDSAWIVGGLTGTYSSREQSFVQSPCFDFTNLINPSISLCVWWQSEYDPSSNPPLFVDGANVQYSTDGGQVWTILEGQSGSFTNNWYNALNITAKPGYLCSGNAPLVVPGWSGTGAGGSGNWLRTQHQLQFLAGVPSVTFRVAFGATFLTNTSGFGFDDVSICESPEVDIYPPNDSITLCAGQSITLDAGCDPLTGAGLPGYTYQWEDGPTPLQGDSCRWEIFTKSRVIVQATNQCQMIDRDTLYVEFSPAQAPPNPPVIVFCPKDSFNLGSGNNNPNVFQYWTYFNELTGTWDFVSTAPAIRDSRPGKYAVLITDIFGCRVEDTTTMVLDTVPPVVLPMDDTVCIGTPYTLLMPPHVPGTNYSWLQDGTAFANTQSISPTAAAEYTGILTTPFGCFNTDTFRLGVSLPPITDFGLDRVECGPFCLTAIPGTGAGFDILWDDGDTSASRCFNPPYNGNVRVINPFGCVARDTIEITAGNPYIFDLGPDQVICGGGNITLDAGNAGAGAQYQWNTGTNDRSQTLVVNQAGVYIVSVTNADGCTTTDTVETTTSSPLGLSLGGNRVLCGRPGDVVELVGLTPGGRRYQWSGGSNATTPNITVTGPGTYALTVRDSLGCSFTDQVQVTRRATPYNGDFTVADPVNNSSYAYLTDPLTFSAVAPSGTSSINWDFGDGFTGSGSPINHTYQSLDTFMVTLVIADANCTDTIRQEAGTRLNFIGIDNTLGVETSIIPNPNDGRFAVKLKWENISEATITIRDLQGRAIGSRKLQAARTHNESFNLETQAKGMYFLHIQTPEGEAVEKILVY